MGLTYEEQGYRRLRLPQAQLERLECSKPTKSQVKAYSSYKSSGEGIEPYVEFSKEYLMSSSEKKFEWVLPIRLDSPNKSMHWRQRHSKNKRIERMLRFHLKPEIKECKLPCIFILTRIGPRKMDHDNLIYSFKKTRDVLSDLMIPGLAPGQADSDSRLRWIYEQENQGVGIYAIRIEVRQL